MPSFLTRFLICNTDRDKTDKAFARSTITTTTAEHTADADAYADTYPPPAQVHLQGMPKRKSPDTTTTMPAKKNKTAVAKKAAGEKSNEGM